MIIFSELQVYDLWDVPLTVECLFGEHREVELRDQCELPIPSIERQQQQQQQEGEGEEEQEEQEEQEEEGPRLSFNLIEQ